MKALSVKQPWATLLVEGEKTIEVRSFSTKYRGELLICASASPKNVFWRDPEDDVNRLLHAGCIIGIVELMECRPMVEADDDASYGNYVPDSFAWVMRPMSYCRPDKITGKLGFFELPDDKVVRIANDATDWIFNYPCPQGEIKFSDKCPLLD